MKMYSIKKWQDLRVSSNISNHCLISCHDYENSPQPPALNRPIMSMLSHKIAAEVYICGETSGHIGGLDLKQQKHELRRYTDIYN